MTEEEAKTKWCPFARTSLWDGVNVHQAGNRTLKDGPSITAAEMSPAGCRCIGSACMAWAWDFRPAMAEANKRNPEAYPEFGTEPTGHCGMTR